MAKRKLSMGTIFFIVFMDLLGVGIVIPVLAPLLLQQNTLLPVDTSYATRTLMIGVLTAMYPLAQFFGSPILGAMSDRLGRKKILLLSQAGSMLGYIMFAIGILQGNLWMLIGSRLLDGFTGGNISVALSAIADISSKEAKAKNFGFVGMAFGLGFILGPFIGGKLADPTLVSWFNAATPFFFAALLTLINMGMVAVRFSETLKTSVYTKISLLTGFRNIAKGFSIPNLRTMFIVVFLFTFGFNFFTQFFQVYLVEKFSFTESQIGDMFAYVGLWLAFTQGFLGPYLTKRWKSAQILTVSLLGLAIALPVLLIPDRGIYFIALLPFIALFQGMNQPNSTAVVSDLAGPESQGEVLGINQSIQALAQTIPPILAGVLFAVDSKLPFFAASAFTFIAWMVFTVFYRRNRQAVFHEV